MPFFDLLLNLFLVALTIAGTWAATSQVVRNRTTQGVSLISTAMVLTSVSTWLAYGIVQGNDAQVLTSAVSAAGAITTLVIGFRTRSLRTGATVSSVAGYAMVVAVLGAVAGVAAVGGVATLFSTLNKLPQVAESWKNPGGVAVSISSNIMGATTSAGWVLYGGMRADHLVVATSAIGVAHGIYVATRTIQGRRMVSSDTYTTVSNRPQLALAAA